MHINIAFDMSDCLFYLLLTAVSVVSFCLLSAGILFSCLLLSRGARPSRVPRLIVATMCCISLAASAVLGVAILIVALRNAVVLKWTVDVSFAAVLAYNARPKRIGEVILIPLNAAFLCASAILAVEGL